MIKFQQGQALTSHFESFWSIVLWDVMIFYVLDYLEKKLGRAQTLSSFVK